jgi:hypothetical protein
MPKNKAMAPKPPMITRLQGKLSFWMGPPPVFGKPVTFGKSVAVGGTLVGVDVGVDVGVSVGVDVGVDVAVGVVVFAIAVNVGAIAVSVAAIAVCVAGGGTTGVVHAVQEIWLVSNVTAPFLARALPGIMTALVFRVMLVSARIFPWNDVFVPSVAEVPICQYTLQPVPPLIMETDELLAVVSVLPILKIKTESGLPWALSVSVPVN